MTSLEQAQRLAQAGRLAEMQAVCRQLTEPSAGAEPETVLSVGALLLTFGFLSQAQACFEDVCRRALQDLRPLVNRANLAREAGDHAEASRLYQALQSRLPDQPVIRRNRLVSLEYDPAVSDRERLAQAQAWGQWATARAGGPRPRPPAVPLAGRPLRVGYVSADLCQHTVGLFVKDVLASHDPTRITAYAYSAGTVHDWVTDAIRAATHFREVAALDDPALAARIRQDGIDLLVDLSGHTAGSRLTVFAHRPAPVQLSWLGYFATTGLASIDAVLLDPWHAPPGMEAQFVERIIRLPGGRFCYRPVPWAPATVAPPPSLRRGFITFGCFNNTAKLNPAVYDTWARVLTRVPDSRLVLKWRTFNDAALRQAVTAAFADRGVAPERIECRGPSFHADLLPEYGDIDIALDPFPFTGGLTSCEALWMGVPVVTWPQSRVVSRQTFALLSAIGLSWLAAEGAAAYEQIAVALARDIDHLARLRLELRRRMVAAPLCDLQGFTARLEDCFCTLFRDISADQKADTTSGPNQSPTEDLP